MSWVTIPGSSGGSSRQSRRARVRRVSSSPLCQCSRIGVRAEFVVLRLPFIGLGLVDHLQDRQPRQPRQPLSASPGPPRPAPPPAPGPAPFQPQLPAPQPGVGIGVHPGAGGVADVLLRAPAPPPCRAAAGRARGTGPPGRPARRGSPTRPPAGIAAACWRPGRHPRTSSPSILTIGSPGGRAPEAMTCSGSSGMAALSKYWKLPSVTLTAPTASRGCPPGWSSSSQSTRSSSVRAAARCRRRRSLRRAARCQPGVEGFGGRSPACRGERLQRAVPVARAPQVVAIRREGPEPPIRDPLPELAQPRQPVLPLVAGDQRRVDRADRDAGQPVRLQPRLVHRLVDARLVGAERPAALQHERDAAEGAGGRAGVASRGILLGVAWGSDGPDAAASPGRPRRTMLPANGGTNHGRTRAGDPHPERPAGPAAGAVCRDAAAQPVSAVGGAARPGHADAAVAGAGASLVLRPGARLPAARRRPDQRRAGRAPGADHGEPGPARHLRGHAEPVCRAATDPAGRDRALPPPCPVRAALRDGGRRRVHRGGWREGGDAAVRPGADAELAVARPRQCHVAADDLAGRAGYPDRALFDASFAEHLAEPAHPETRAGRRQPGCAMAGTCGRCAAARADRRPAQQPLFHYPYAEWRESLRRWPRPASPIRISAMRWSSPIRPMAAPVMPTIAAHVRLLPARVRDAAARGAPTAPSSSWWRAAAPPGSTAGVSAGGARHAGRAVLARAGAGGRTPSWCCSAIPTARRRRSSGCFARRGFSNRPLARRVGRRSRGRQAWRNR